MMQGTYNVKLQGHKLSSIFYLTLMKPKRVLMYLE
jgi:hypothetical protein